jgi:hypothetical protein
MGVPLRVITSRPVRRRPDDLIDLPGQLLAAGLEPVERCAALLAEVRDGRIVRRCQHVRPPRGTPGTRRRHPVALVAHEDVSVLRKPPD